MGVEHGQTVDAAVVEHADHHVYVLGEAADDHLDRRALFGAVDADDALVGAGVLLGLVLGAVGQHVLHDDVKQLLPVGLRGAGQRGVRAEKDKRADKDDGYGYKQFLHVHLPAPPFITPKRLGGSALSSAQAQAFITRMA